MNALTAYLEAFTCFYFWGLKRLLRELVSHVIWVGNSQLLAGSVLICFKRLLPQIWKKRKKGAGRVTGASHVSGLNLCSCSPPASPSGQFALVTTKEIVPVKVVRSVFCGFFTLTRSVTG